MRGVISPTHFDLGSTDLRLPNELGLLGDGEWATGVIPQRALPTSNAPTWLRAEVTQ